MIIYYSNTQKLKFLDILDSIISSHIIINIFMFQISKITKDIATHDDFGLYQNHSEQL